MKDERYDRLLTLQQGISRGRNESWIGKALPVLIEKLTSAGEGMGRSFRDAPEVDGSVRVRGAGLQPGEFVLTRVVAAEPYGLVGTAMAPRRNALPVAPA